jgi:hypothetical protein
MHVRAFEAGESMKDVRNNYFLFFVATYLTLCKELNFARPVINPLIKKSRGPPGHNSEKKQENALGRLALLSMSLELCHVTIVVPA